MGPGLGLPCQWRQGLRGPQGASWATAQKPVSDIHGVVRLLPIGMRTMKGVEVGWAGSEREENKEAEGGCTIETSTARERAIREQER